MKFNERISCKTCLAHRNGDKTKKLFFVETHFWAEPGNNGRQYDEKVKFQQRGKKGKSGGSFVLP